MPVTLVVGERDQKFRLTAARMAELMEPAMVTVVAGAGHAAHLEAPETVAAAIVGPPAC
jgi:pimeloyl-ACP methyl ester carboxylesterase